MRAEKNQFMGAAIVCCKAVLTFLAYEKIVHATYVAISNQVMSAAHNTLNVGCVRFVLPDEYNKGGQFEFG